MAQSPHETRDDDHGGGHGVVGAGEHGAVAHRHGEMDITVQQKTFEGFIRFWVLVFGGSALVLIFLALTNA